VRLVRSKLTRRLVTIPAVLLAWPIAVAASPLALAMAAVADRVRGAKPGAWPRARLAGFLPVYLTCEVAGLAALAGAWVVTLGRPQALVDATYAIQGVWTKALFGAIRSLYGLRVELEGADLFSPGPTIVLVRHASIIDTLLPTALLSVPLGMRLRFVLKRELIVEPCLDVAGHRVPNCFVERDGASSEREIERVGALGVGLGPREGALLYPEGTRFTPAKRDRALERLRTSSPERAERLAGLRHLAPIRPGGVLALLDAAPNADVVIVTHAGLEGLAEVGDLAGGGLVGRTIRLRVQRYARAEVPSNGADRLAWLDARWLEQDAWLASVEPPAPPPSSDAS
jgi:1-acyl-sn-glycerol-3-phosphate acyltransferase